jgi:hypothetical protein
LNKIDCLIELFQMKNIDYKFLKSKGDFLNDYDRLFSTVKKIKCDFIYCSIEDTKNEPSSFFPANKYLKILYSLICQDDVKINEIKQYSRCKNPSANSLLRLNTLTREELFSHNNNEKFMVFLESVNKKMASVNAKDNLTLLYVSLLIWNEYLIAKTDCVPLTSSVYVTSVICNLVLLVLKKALVLYKDLNYKSTVISREIDLLHSDMVYYVLVKIRDDKSMLGKVEEMVNIFRKFCFKINIITFLIF